jgi:hypothetical protein
MVNYICPICHKNIGRKDSYRIHINRKNPCKPPPVDEIKLLKQEVEDLKKIINEIKNSISQ